MSAPVEELPVVPTDRGPALEVVGLSSGYGQGAVVREVSLTVPRGAVTALIGANGAGKSTLLKTVSGLVKPMRGSVRLHGEDVSRLAPERRAAKGICHITEGRGIYRSLTVQENLVMQSPRGGEKLAVERATSVFPRLAERMGQQAGTLSGGEQQMLSLSAAYVRGASVILVDEPSLGLAPLVVDLVFEFLDTVRGEDVSLLVVDQYAHRVLALAESAYVLRRGQIAFSGAAAELLQGDMFEHYIGNGPTDADL